MARQDQNRRENRDTRHQLSVKSQEPDCSISIVCSCKRPIPLRRQEDRESISMSDILEIFRIHVMRHDWASETDY